MSGLLYLLFFLSGTSGLIYQVVWVRVFGNVFGNTVYSASLVVAVFMLGLGVGSYGVGAWADRRYRARPGSLLGSYGLVEIAIAVLGLAISLVLPHLVAVSAFVSSYTREPGGWYALSMASYVSRVVVAVGLLAPITLLMGGTLTLLIRHQVRQDVERAGWPVAVLYGVNTAGAALGCLLTDFVFVPTYGLLRTQLIAVALNAMAAAGALWMAGRAPAARPARRSRDRTATPATNEIVSVAPGGTALVAGASVALALSGFAALGMEIVWFRHFTILLGQFRAVFSLLLTIILVGIGAGSLAAGIVAARGGGRGRRQAVEWFIGVQATFIVATLVGLAVNEVPAIDRLITAGPALQAAGGQGANAALAASGWMRVWVEVWFNVRPMLAAVAVPSFLMGFSFPFANAIVQRAEGAVGRRAGVLYLANTAGAVGGSLVAGFGLLPTLGIQRTSLILMLVAAASVVPLYVAARKGEDLPGAEPNDPAPSRRSWIAAGALVIALAAIGVWWRLPSDFIISRALPRLGEGERLLALDEGLNEVIAVTDAPGRGRRLLTNGHPMSSTAWMSQRYMRALAHVPLLSIDRPRSALVIGFGVGNTTHAVSLHPSIERLDVADLSRDILEHGSYFKEVNGGVLAHPRVRVLLNDGRHHLQMMPPGSYDLVTLEPPPIGYAGVAALYSREFYALARSRLAPNGYVSQWLPTNQVPSSTALAMTRAFIDVFPNAVLISGAEADLLLLGTNGDRLEIVPSALVARLAAAPRVKEDLERFDLGSVREIVGSFVGSSRTLADAAASTSPVTDDRPIQEYGVRSLLDFGDTADAPLVDLSQVSSWCPRCFEEGRPAGPAQGLDVYMSLLDRAYLATPAEIDAVRKLTRDGPRRLAGSAYLGAIVPETADVHTFLGITLAAGGHVGQAVDELRRAVALDPRSAAAHWHLGTVLSSRGATDEAVAHLETSVGLNPENGRARYDLASLLLERRQIDAAVGHLEAAVRLMPDSAEAHNNLGIALGWQGHAEAAITHFEKAVALNPGFAEAQRNLALARRLQASPSRDPGR